MEKIVIYTAISGECNQHSNLDCLHGNNLFSNPVMDAKIFKILGHLFYPDADILIWLDSNITPKISKEKLVEKYLGDSDLFLPHHPQRTCIYQEFKAIKDIGKFNSNIELMDKLNKQEQFYRSTGYPEFNGLFECGFIIRRNIKVVNDLFNEWWAEVCMWQQRDQVSFPYVLSKYDIKIKGSDISNIRFNDDFEYVF